MGSDVSKTVEKKPSRTKTTLGDKNVNQEEIAEFASQLNHLATLRLDDELDRYDYNIFKKIPFTGKFAPLPFCSKISTSSDSGIFPLTKYFYATTVQAILSRTCVKSVFRRESTKVIDSAYS